MFTPRRDSPLRGSPYGSPFDQSRKSPFSAGSVTRTGKPRGAARPSFGLLDTSLVGGKGLGTSFTIEEAPTHRVVSYGQALPVQVSETLARKTTALITCKLDPNGWAWLVSGKQLLIWRYVPTAVNKNITCCELFLPTSELHHKAGLTSVISVGSRDGQQSAKDSSASVINVSPEGTIRFWPNIANPGIFLESAAGLRGKEFHMVASFPPFGCILMTTDNAMLLVSPNQSSVMCRSISESAGLFSGIGRKMSSFLLGSGPSSHNLHLPKLAVGPGGVGANKRFFYVLANGSLQKWAVSDGRETLLFQVDVLDKLSSEIFNVIEIEQESLVKIVPLDISTTGYSIAILACAVVRMIDTFKVILLLGTMETSGKEVSNIFESLVPLEYSLEIENEKEIPEFDLLIPAGSYQAFIHNKDVITANPVSEAKESLVEVKFQSESSKLVGSGSFGNDVVFLSKRHGMFTVVAYYKDTPSSVLQLSANKSKSKATRPGGNVVMGYAGHASLALTINLPKRNQVVTYNFQIGRVKDSTFNESEEKPIADQDEDLQDTLRNAFYKHSEGNMFEATEIVSMMSTEAKINEAVIAIGNEIIDGIPASDPRWAQQAPGGTQVTTESVLIIKQLKDKERVFEFFLKFLDDVEIFDKLTVYRENDEDCYTKFKLCEQAEKLTAAQALQSIILREDILVQEVIEALVEKRNEEVPGQHLTYQDVFFREVSRIHDLFPVLSEYEDQTLNQRTSIKDQIDVIMNVNSIIIAALKNAWIYRQSKATFYHPVIEDNTEIIPYIPWTATNDANGIRSVLKKQIELTEERALSNTDSTAISKNLLQQAVDLSDLFLDGFVTQLQFLKATTEDHSQLQLEFENERRSVIEPLIEREHYTMALALAEKYQDYALMITICDKEQNMEKLEKYKITLAEKGFLDFLFKWYLERGELGKLLSQGASPQLENFLASHNHLSWLHYIGTGEYEKASEVLHRTANNESAFIARKKTMLSLGKLCLLASEDGSDPVLQKLEAIQSELDVILHQETLPSVVLENAGIDSNHMPPFSVEDLIELYTGDSNTEANEYDFKRALDLIAFLDPERKETLRNQIWCKAILRDDWNKSTAADPIAMVMKTLFCKCAMLFENQTPDIQGVLPTIDDLQASMELERRELSENENFLFLMKAFYESLASR